MITALLLSAAVTAATFADKATGLSGEYTVSFPDGEAKAKAGAYGLLVFFHGSGGGPSYASNFGDLAKAAAAYDLVPLSIQAPNKGVTWADAQTGATNHYYDYVQTLLSRVIFEPHPAVSRNRTVFVGLSAGSTFVSGDFLPRYGEDYQGGAVLLCGGAAPTHHDQQNVKAVSDTFKHKFHLFFHIQQADFLFGQTMQGYHYWLSRGARADIEHPPGGSHCGFDIQKELLHGLQTVLGG